LRSTAASAATGALSGLIKLAVVALPVVVQGRERKTKTIATEAEDRGRKTKTSPTSRKEKHEKRKT
jgi:hypothetical protein